MYLSSPACCFAAGGRLRLCSLREPRKNMPPAALLQAEALLRESPSYNPAWIVLWHSRHTGICFLFICFMILVNPFSFPFLARPKDALISHHSIRSLRVLVRIVRDFYSSISYRSCWSIEFYSLGLLIRCVLLCLDF